MKTITIDLDEKQIMRKVMKHFAKQKHRAMAQASAPFEDSAVCRYRTEDGEMCAIGCLIPDDQYYPEIEGKSVDTSLIFSFPNATMIVVASLQECHDNSENIDDLRDRLMYINNSFEVLPESSFVKLLENITEWS